MARLNRPRVGWLALCVVLVACEADTFSPDDGAEFAAWLGTRTSDAAGLPSSGFGAQPVLRHHHLDAVLRRYVAPAGVDFAALWNDPEARTLLRDYAVVLAETRPEDMEDPAERVAFWLNAYTAITIEALAGLVATQGEAADVSVGGFELFTAQTHQVAGFELTLEELEHLVLRGDAGYPDVDGTPATLVEPLLDQHRLLFAGGNDGRINFAISFGTQGFPPMPSRAYRAATLDAALDARVRSFLNDATLGANERGVSVLFDWFERDFVLDAGSVRGFIARYFTGDVGAVAIDQFLVFSWRVRQARRESATP